MPKAISKKKSLKDGDKSKFKIKISSAKKEKTTKKKSDKKKIIISDSDDEKEEKSNSDSEEEDVKERIIKHEKKTWNAKENLKNAMRGEDKYDKLELRDQIYKRPDTYAGSDAKVKTLFWKLMTTKDKLDKKKLVISMKKENIKLAQVIRQCFLEVFTNSSDNAGHSRRNGVDPKQIEVTVTKYRVTIKNYGVPISTKKKKKFDMHIIEMIFGNLLSGSNYSEDDSMEDGGRNGYGAKLTNIFSKEFDVTVGNSVEKVLYKQSFSDNMKVINKPVIEKGYEGESFVEISYVIDFKRFKYNAEDSDEKDKDYNKKEGKGYPDEADNIFAAYCAHFSWASRIPVIYTGFSLNKGKPFTLYYPFIKDFAGLFHDVSNSFVHYQWDPDVKFKTKKSGEQVPEDPSDMPRLEICVVDAVDNGEFISAVNSLPTILGGSHVEEVAKAVLNPVVKEINASQLKGKGKGKDKDLKEQKEALKKAPKITIADVRPNLFSVVGYRAVGPVFKGQLKEFLSKPKPKVIIPPKLTTKMNKWQLFDRAFLSLEAKQAIKLKKTDGKKKRNVNLDTYEGANEAGGPNSHKCKLIAVEGKSAKGYPTRMVGIVEGGRKYLGIFTLQGKPANVTGKSFPDVSENKEYAHLTEILGLTWGMDYTDPKNLKTLRYGHISFMADSDDDGRHIVGLGANFFYCCHPTLLKVGFVSFYRSPIIRLTKGKLSEKFFLASDYKNWAADKTEAELKKWKPKYLKGLASSSKTEVQDDCKDPKWVEFIMDLKAAEVFKLAFDVKMADARKLWIAAYEYLYSKFKKSISISKYFHQEFILYAIANIKRSIPSLLDNLKVGQRKIVFYTLLEWKSYIYGKGKATESKVSQFASGVSKETDYHHNDNCIADTIVLMAQDHMGTNNMNYFVQDSDFGSRDEGGASSAGAARYIFTKPEWWLKYMFPIGDESITPRQEEDNVKIEPAHLNPILPLGVINGCRGIATGHSTFIPAHDPMVIANWFEIRLQDDYVYDPDADKILPWYRGFTGTISILDKRKNKVEVVKPEEDSKKEKKKNKDSNDEKGEDSDEKEEDDADLSDEDIDTIDEEGKSVEVKSKVNKKYRYSMITKGVYKRRQDKSIEITELPIGSWTAPYLRWLKSLQKEKKIKTIVNDSDDVKVNFLVRGYTGKCTSKDLKLRRSYGMGNMVLLDINGKPKKYDSVEDICEDFYIHRLAKYAERRKYIIGNIKTKVDDKNLRIKFLTAVCIDKTIIIYDQNTESIRKQMKKHDLPESLLDVINLRNCTKESIKKLMREIEVLNEELKDMKATSPNEMWLKELLVFKAAYMKHYKIKDTSRKPVVAKEKKIKIVIKSTKKSSAKKSSKESKESSKKNSDSDDKEKKKKIKIVVKDSNKGKKLSPKKKFKVV